MVTTAKPCSVDDFIEAVSSHNRHATVQFLWDSAKSGCYTPWSGSNGDLVAGILAERARKLAVLLRENTVVKTVPFDSFTQRLADHLRDARDSTFRLKCASDMRNISREYWSNSNNFASLNTTRHRLKGVWGDFYFCGIKGDDSFFVDTSGSVRNILVHADQWMKTPTETEALAQKYADHIADNLANTDAIVCTPLARHAGISFLWPTLMRYLPKELPVFREARTRNNEGNIISHYVPVRGAEHSNVARVTLVGDVISPHGSLEQTVKRATKQFGDLEVRGVFLYQYPYTSFEATGIKEHHVLYDVTEHPELLPEGIATSMVNGTAQYDPAPSPSSPFGYASLRHVDPGLITNPHLARERTFLSSEEMRKKYGGKWVAVHGLRGVIASGSSCDEVMENLEAIGGKRRDRRAMIEYVQQ